MSASTASKIKVANAPCSWGAHEFDHEGKAPTFEQVLDEMAKADYTGTELGDWGFMPTDPGALKAAIAKRNLTMLAAFVPVNLSDASAHTEGVERAVRTAKLLTAVASEPFIVLADDNGTNEARTKNAGRINQEHAMTDSQWRTFIYGTERVASAVLERTGVRTVFHHHCAGFIETPEEIDRLLAETDPGLVSLCFDTGHYTFGGGNALEGLKRHASRIKHVHFKDCEPAIAKRSSEKEWDYFESVRNGVFCELGKGVVAFDAIVSELNRLDYKGWAVVEQDVLPGMGSPYESALRNRAFLSQFGI